VTEYRWSGAARGRRFAIVAARFNRVVVERLVEGARACLTKHGVDGEDVDVAWVPGAFEIPQAAVALARSGEYDAIVCLGAVVRGETAHFDFVAAEAARGIAAVGRATGVPATFGVLTTESLEQALDRAGGRHGNKGWDAAQAAIEMAGLLDNLPGKNRMVGGET